VISRELVAASTQPLVLAILAEGESYGYELIQKVRERSGGQIEWSEGMLYPFLHWMEDQGLIESRWKESDSGRRRKFYLRSILIFVLIGFLAIGCNREQSGSPQSEQKTAPGAVEQQTAFEKCLANWSSGNQEAAVKDFLELNLRDGRLFSTGSALAMSETQFARMPAAAREKLSSPMLADLQAIKELCQRVKETGQQARAGGDSAKAAKCFSQIQTLGDHLDEASVVLIGQKVGQSLKRIAAQ